MNCKRNLKYAVVLSFMTHSRKIFFGSFVDDVIRMSKRERTHEGCRKIHCAACGKKDIKCLPVTSSVEEAIKEEVYKCYNVTDSSYPSGVCGSCRTNLFLARKGKVVPAVLRDRWNSMDYSKYRPPVRNGTCSATCPLCKSGRYSAGNVESDDKPDLPRVTADDGDDKEAKACLLSQLFFNSSIHGLIVILPFLESQDDSKNT